MITSVALVASLFAGAQAMTINTPPQVRQCIPVSVSWEDGEAPYFLQVLEGGSTTDQLVDLGEQEGTSFRWQTKLSPGTSITLGLTDSSGETVYSDEVEISEGNGSDCEEEADGEPAASAASDASEEESSSTASAADSSSSESSSESSSSSSSSSSSAADSSASADSSEEETDDSSASVAKASFAGVVAAAGLMAIF